MAGFDHKTIDPKWQAYWDREQTFLTPTDRTRPKYYVLDMFPYPSGDGLHVGHPKGYTATDIVARAKRMMGFNVLRVMGWDCFGLARRAPRREDRRAPERDHRAQHRHVQGSAPAARACRTTGRASSRRAIRTTTSGRSGSSRSCTSVASRIRREVPVNFCPALGTVLANEEVADGKYIETGDPVEKRLLEQWMLRITDYADRLDEDLVDARLAERRAEAAARLDRQVDRREREASRSPSVAATSPCSRRVPTRCSAARMSCSRRSTARRSDHDRRATRRGRAYRVEVGKRSERDRTVEAADAPKTGVFDRRVRDQPGQRQADSDLDRRLRARELRHRCGVRVPGARRARSRVRDEVRVADHRGRRRAARTCRSRRTSATART